MAISIDEGRPRSVFRVAISSIYGFHPFFENVDYLRVVTLWQGVKRERRLLSGPALLIVA